MIFAFVFTFCPKKKKKKKNDPLHSDVVRCSVLIARRVWCTPVLMCSVQYALRSPPPGRGCRTPPGPSAAPSASPGSPGTHERLGLELVLLWKLLSGDDSHRLLQFGGELLDDGPDFTESHVRVGVVVVPGPIVTQQTWNKEILIFCCEETRADSAQTRGHFVVSRYISYSAMLADHCRHVCSCLFVKVGAT